MPHKPLCLRCHAPMQHLQRAGLLTRKSEPFLPVGYVRQSEVTSFEADIYCCPSCGHLEFFRHDPDGGEDSDSDQLAQIKCPKCGRMHDIDCPKCPFCGREV